MTDTITPAKQPQSVLDHLLLAPLSNIFFPLTSWISVKEKDNTLTEALALGLDNGNDAMKLAVTRARSTSGLRHTSCSGSAWSPEESSCRVTFYHNLLNALNPRLTLRWGFSTVEPPPYMTLLVALPAES